MSIPIKQTFSVNAPVERVWRFLTNPREVAQCLPGAEIIEALSEREFGGRVQVRVGPITAAYTGTATLAEVDEAGKRIRLIGEGRELGGGGSGMARLVMEGSVAPNENGGSVVRVDATVQIAGRVMQFGRGLVESVSQQIFREFAEQARARLEAPVLADATSAAPPPARPGREMRLIPMLWRAAVDWFRRLFR
jgi:carbon monoxide dehydrogenase subunit G